MGDSISPLMLNKLPKKEGSVLIIENVLFPNLHQKIYLIQEKLLRRSLLNY